jgi:hypothetical protein
MGTFMQKHAPLVIGTISAPDRIIIKGYLPFANPAVAEGFLNKNNIKFIEFKKFAKTQSEKLVTAAQRFATSKNRPSVWFYACTPFYMASVFYPSLY